MTTFLLELLTEEIPARMQSRAATQLRERFSAGLAGKVTVGSVETFVTPRRLALLAHDIAPASKATAEERRGPRSDAPSAAIDGFLRSTGLAIGQLEERASPKGNFLYAVIAQPGRPTADLLAELIPAIVRDYDWPKSMRWGELSRARDSIRWVRPLSGIVALLGDAVVPFEIAGLSSGRVTYGHRFLSTGPIEIADQASYVATLRAHHVVVDPALRAQMIETGACAAADAAGLVLVDDPALVAENAGLTEWPVPLLGRFDPAFLDVPREIIQLTMRTNQKYFACTDAAGALVPAFVCVANLAGADASIVAGNAKVLAARLADAKFFWDADVKAGLASFAPKLAEIVFHEKLGTVADKVERVAKLARWLIESGAVRPALLPRSPAVIPANAGTQSGSGSDVLPALGPDVRRDDEVTRLADLAERAARLCKADLTTATVGEFPEVQGIAGRYLALAAGEDPAVADAIRDHYKPVGQGDEVPTAPVSVAVALADKVDSLVGFFGFDERPTGSRDPYALRRAGLGIIAILAKSSFRISLNGLFEHARQLYCQQGRTPFSRELDADASSLSLRQNLERNLRLIWAGPVFDFLADRLKVQQREAGVRHDLIDAVFALGSEDDLVRLLARVHALQAFLTTADGTNLLAGYKRGSNILRIEEAKGDAFEGTIDAAAFVESAEAALAAALDIALPEAQAAVAREDFAGAMTALSRLRPAVDAFFDSVIVNAPDAALRLNRLNLLARFRAAVHNVADFSKIEG